MGQNYSEMSVEELDKLIAEKDIEYKKLSQQAHRLSAEKGILQAQRQIKVYMTTITSLDEEIVKSADELSDKKK
jgi:hypothetical protein